MPYLAALLLENLDHTVKGQEDVEEATRVAFLGIVPVVVIGLFYPKGTG